MELTPFLIKDELVETNEKDPEKHWTVYYHQNKVNGKIYVGITGTSVKQRWGKNGYCYKTQMFYSAIHKYGWDNFEHVIFASNLIESEAIQIEIKLIQLLKSNNHDFGYNITLGGEGRKIHVVKPVYQYDLNGNLIKYWENINDAARSLKTNVAAIYAVCNFQRPTIKGYFF